EIPGLDIERFGFGFREAYARLLRIGRTDVQGRTIAIGTADRPRQIREMPAVREKVRPHVVALAGRGIERRDIDNVAAGGGDLPENPARPLEHQDVLTAPRGRYRRWLIRECLDRAVRDRYLLEFSSCRRVRHIRVECDVPAVPGPTGVSSPFSS